MQKSAEYWVSFHMYRSLCTHLQVSYHVYRSLFTYIGLFSHIFLFTYLACRHSQKSAEYWVSFCMSIGLFSHMCRFPHICRSLFTCVGLFSQIYKSLFTYLACRHSQKSAHCQNYCCNGCMSDPTKNATPPESTKPSHSNSSVQIQITPKCRFEFVPRDTEESEFLDLVDFGGGAFSVETVIGDVYTIVTYGGGYD